MVLTSCGNNKIEDKMDYNKTALEQNLIATLAENGCSEKQSMTILEETLKHIADYESNLVENRVSQAASQAMPEPNSQVCEWEMKEYYYKTSCNNNNSYFSIVDHFDLDNWKYCPYCGKLIHKLL